MLLHIIKSEITAYPINSNSIIMRI